MFILKGYHTPGSSEKTVHTEKKAILTAEYPEKTTPTAIELAKKKGGF